ncbi:MAG: HEAT repeat domain-containing protein [Clostridiales bacterium]|nr:HEAT repeat domain-containing protein [Clostridiales bacterium]
MGIGMSLANALKEKILKLGAKQKLDAIIKYSDNPSSEVRMTVAMALGMIQSYDSGIALVPLLRDSDPMVRATAATAAGDIHAKVCEEYVKKLAFADTDPNVRMFAKKAFNMLRDSVV